MLVVYGRASSSNVQKVLWLCEELGLPYSTAHDVPPGKAKESADYAKLNPNGLIPTIDDDGFVLWESNAIVRYLAAKHSNGALFPGDLRVRADAEWAMVSIPPQSSRAEIVYTLSAVAGLAHHPFVVDLLATMPLEP